MGSTFGSVSIIFSFSIYYINFIEKNTIIFLVLHKEILSFKKEANHLQTKKL
nr:MAG TPA: hypothetical protein [Caudoviricetes sp.]